MSIQIKVDANSYQRKQVSLNGKIYYIEVMYNTSDDKENNGKGAWYFNLIDRSNNDLLSGVKILPIQNLTSRYLDINTALDGDIYCVNVKDTSADIDRYNFGTDLKYQLWYISNQEQLDEGIK